MIYFGRGFLQKIPHLACHSILLPASFLLEQTQRFNFQVPFLANSTSALIKIFHLKFEIKNISIHPMSFPPILLAT